MFKFINKRPNRKCDGCQCVVLEDELMYISGQRIVCLKCAVEDNNKQYIKDYARTLSASERPNNQEPE